MSERTLSATNRLFVGAWYVAANGWCSVCMLEDDPQRTVGQEAPNQTASLVRAERQAERPWHGDYARSGHTGFEGLHAVQFDGMSSRRSEPNARLTEQKAAGDARRAVFACALSPLDKRSSSSRPHGRSSSRR